MGGGWLEVARVKCFGGFSTCVSFGEMSFRPHRGFLAVLPHMYLLANSFRLCIGVFADLPPVYFSAKRVSTRVLMCRRIYRLYLFRRNEFSAHVVARRRIYRACTFRRNELSPA